MEQRHKAVLEVLEARASVTDVARRYWVGRQAVHAWLRRYAAEGLAGDPADGLLGVAVPGALTERDCAPAGAPDSVWVPIEVVTEAGAEGSSPSAATVTVTVPGTRPVIG